MELRKYGVVKFLKEKSPLFDDVYTFTPMGILTGKLETKDQIFLSSTSDDVLCLVSKFNEVGFDQDEEYYGFPFILTDSVEKAIKDKVNRTDEVFFNQYFDDVSSMEYVSVIESKDNKKVSIITAIDKDNKHWYPYFDRSFYETLNKRKEESPSKKEEFLSKPRIEILEELKKIIIAQDEQVTTLVNTIYANQRYSDFEGTKENILIIGSTGTGKTAMVDNLAKLIDVPIVRKDATKYSTTGYVGGNVIDLLKALYIESGYNKEKTEKGIIAIDEIDKLGKHEQGSTVRTSDVQQELLGLIEGGVYSFEVGNRDVSIDTSKITFILSGAFQNVIEIKKKDSKKMGFGVETSNQDSTMVKITRDDLSKYGGMEQEFLRRLPVIIQTNSFNKESLKEVLTKSKISNLIVWQNAFKLKDNVDLIFLNESLDLIVDKALQTNAGASGLKAIISDTLSDIRPNIIDGNIKDCSVYVSSETVNEPTKYLVKGRNKKSELSKRAGESN